MNRYAIFVVSLAKSSIFHPHYFFHLIFDLDKKYSILAPHVFRRGHTISNRNSLLGCSDRQKKQK
jgi:hypothetical protein